MFNRLIDVFIQKHPKRERERLRKQLKIAFMELLGQWVDKSIRFLGIQVALFASFCVLFGPFKLGIQKELWRPSLNGMYGFEFIYKIVWFYSKALNKVLSWEKSSLKSRMSYIKLFDFSNNSRGIRFASFNYLFMRYKKLFDFSPKPFFLITFSYIGKLPCASFDDHFTPTKCFI